MLTAFFVLIKLEITLPLQAGCFTPILMICLNISLIFVASSFRFSAQRQKGKSPLLNFRLISFLVLVTTVALGPSSPSPVVSIIQVNFLLLTSSTKKVDQLSKRSQVNLFFQLCLKTSLPLPPPPSADSLLLTIKTLELCISFLVFELGLSVLV